MDASAWRLQPAQGFHTVSIADIHASPDFSDCTLHLAHVLPPLIFADPYELALRPTEYTFAISAQSDLEAPDFVLSQEPTYLFLNVSRHPDAHTITVHVPLHLRYGSVAAESRVQSVQLPSPRAFWACAPGRLGASDVYLPSFFSTQFTGSTLFPIGWNTTEDGAQLQVPVGSKGDLMLVEYGTILAVALCFIQMSYAVIKTAARHRLHVQRKVD